MGKECHCEDIAPLTPSLAGHKTKWPVPVSKQGLHSPLLPASFPTAAVHPCSRLLASIRASMV